MAKTDPMVISMAEQACDQLYAESGATAKERQRPKEPAVRSRLTLIMRSTPFDTKEPSGPSWATLVPAPRKRKLQLIIAGWREPKVAPEMLWDIGEKNPTIDPAATGALAEVWKMTMTHPGHEPLTVRLAEWVAKLRFYAKAGGSVTGEVVDVAELFRWAAIFSARERAALVANEPNARTMVVLAMLSMSPEQYAVAVRTGVLNDEGIDREQELTTYYPLEGRQWHIESQLAAGGRPDLTGYAEINAEILDSHPTGVEEVWALSMKLALENDRWLALRDDDEHPGISNVMGYLWLKDIAGASDIGELEQYDPGARIDDVMSYTVHLYDSNGWTVSQAASVVLMAANT